jgi:hypothetical protein
MATTISGTSITYNDGTVQTKAVGQSGATVIQSPGTFAIPSTTTRIKVTCVGGGSGQTVPGAGAGASGGSSSFGSYITSTGGTGSAAGSSQGATLQYGADPIGAYGNSLQQLPISMFGYSGGNGIRYFDAPFPQTQVPVTVGAGGGGGGGYGSFGPAAQAGNQINGGRGGQGPMNQSGGGGGGASGTSAQMQGTGGQDGTQVPAYGAGQPGQPGANPYQGLSGGLGGQGSGGAGGNAGYQGIVIVEYF